MMSIIFYDDRPCGAGKSYDECLDIIKNPGLYLYAVERRAAVEERAQEIRDIAAAAGTSVHVVTICSMGQNAYDDPDRIGGTSVRVRVEGLGNTYTGGHVVAIITHEALKTSDLSGFRGWKLVIDERPSIWDRQSLSSKLSKDLLTHHFKLEQRADKKARRIISTSNATAKDFDEDSCGNPLAVMAQRIIGDRCEVATSLQSFDQLDVERKWEWWSIWAPTSLKVFDQVTMLAHGLTQSVAYQIIRSKWPEFEWVRLDRATELRHMRRTVVVHYYARAHQASRTLWDSPRGRRYLTAIGNDIASRVTADRHIWTCNRNERSLFERPDHETSLLPGKCLSPRQQGSNLWSCRNEATILFTAKPSACDLSIAKVIGISPEAIVETRELDIMVQFACRTSVRVAESTETVHLYVYDEVQARHLEAYFQSTGYCDVVLDLIDISGMGIAEYERDSRPGRKRKVLTPEEAKAAQKAKREKETDRKRRQRADKKKTSEAA